MKKKKLSIEEVRCKVDAEGLSYCIMNWFDSKEIEDKQLAKLWKNARKNLEQIELLLKEDESDKDGDV